MMRLYGYWRSSASYRVRIALALKGIAVEQSPVNLKQGAQLQPNYQAINVQPLVPVLELKDGTKLSQSLAIIEYLEEQYPDPALLPDDAVLRARIRATAHIIASDIAPIQNLRVLKYIRKEYGEGDDGVQAWAAHWIRDGFISLERIASTSNTEFLLTNAPGYFECCLVPQVYNAVRFRVDMEPFPHLSQIDAKCRRLLAFQSAAPDNQPDAP